MGCLVVPFDEGWDDAEVHLARFGEGLHRIEDTIVRDVVLEDVERHGTCGVEEDFLCKAGTRRDQCAGQLTDDIAQCLVLDGKDIHVGAVVDGRQVGCRWTAEDGC